MHPTIQTAIATQHIRDMQAEAARTAQARTAKARTARAGRTARAARTARAGRTPRLGWLFDLADRRWAARAAQPSPDFCCPDYALTGQCAVHSGAHREAADSGRRS